MATRKTSDTGPAKGSNPAPKGSNIPADELKHYYREMLLIRRFEEKAGQLYGMGLIGGFCHLYIGQEATGAGVLAALREEDLTLTTHRNHGHVVGRGADPGRALAEPGPQISNRDAEQARTTRLGRFCPLVVGLRRLFIRQPPPRLASPEPPSHPNP